MILAFTRLPSVNSAKIPGRFLTSTIDLHLTLTNLNPNQGASIDCLVEGMEALEVNSVDMITAGNLNAYNNFGEEEKVNIRPFNDVSTEGNKLTINMPPKSIIRIAMQ